MDIPATLSLYPAASSEALEAAQTSLGRTLPPGLLDLYLFSDGLTDPHGASVVWPLQDLITKNRRLWEEGVSQDLFFFGNDALGNLLIFVDSATAEKTGYAIHCWVPDLGDAVPSATSLADLLAHFES